MSEPTINRRQSQAIFYDSINDRRRQTDERPALDWSDAATVTPGVIRPGVGEAAPRVERRRYLDGGCE